MVDFVKPPRGNASQSVGNQMRPQPGEPSGRTHADDRHNENYKEASRNENKRDPDVDQSQLVRVKARGHFHKEDNMQGDMTKPGDEFEVPRSRAAQLRANGLIDYSDESMDEEIHGKRDAEGIKQRLETDQKAREIPKNSRASPLRNPKLEYAEPPENGDSQR